ncbi:MAG TPA: helix-turn-helix transcriptional regulator [Ktedonobacterales bacterium]|nr:helix-turn-helix transcriptional regulator [Ktedonobacterales bacterium]
MRTGFSDLGRFSDVSLLILLSLAGGDKHGYAIIEDIMRFSGTKVEPGSLYGALVRLEQKGWIEALPVEDRRRPYRLTPAGAASLRQQVATLQQIVATGVERLALA